MDVVLIYPVNHHWHWRRVNERFEELFYSPTYFKSAELASVDAEQHNQDVGRYRLELASGGKDLWWE